MGIKVFKNLMLKAGVLEILLDVLRFLEKYLMLRKLELDMSFNLGLDCLMIYVFL